MDTSNPAPLVFVDSNEIITGWSEGAELILGWSTQDVLGQPLATIRPENGHGFLAKNGQAVELVISAVPAPHGQTALALRRSERVLLQEQLDLTLSHTDIVGSWNWDVNGDRVFADKRFAETFGVDTQAARAGLPIDQFVSAILADDRDRVTGEIARTLETGEAFRSEYRVRDADGTVRDVVARGRLVLDPEGKPLRFPGVVFDITGRRKAERIAMVMEGRYKSLFEMIDAGFCVIRMIRDEAGNPCDYEFIEVNPAFVRQTGIEDAVGRRMRDIAPDHEQYWFDVYGKVATTQQPIQFEHSADALNRWFEVHAFPIDGAQSDHVAVLFMDKSRQKQIELELRDSEENFRSLSQAMLNLVWTADAEGRPDWFNDRVYEFTGLDHDSVARDGLKALIHPEDLPAALALWQEARASGRVFRTEYRMRRADGAWRWHLVRAVPMRDEEGRIYRWIGTNTDVEHAKRNEAALAQLNATLEQRIDARTEELMQTQRALHQAQKMETLGQLTGGVAHDFKNLLQVIGGNLQLLSKDVATNERAERRVANALAGVSRGAKLAAQLLAFGRRQALEPKVVNLGRFLSGMDDLLRRSIGEAVEVEVIASAGLWNTYVDPAQIENAVLNLAINGRDAMNGHGRLTIEVGNAFLDDEYVRRHDDVAPGQYIMLAVSDTGSGMSPDIIDKVFEPFFSTKPEGQGTGLGLSMVYGFVKQSGGHIKIYSEVGEGTTVRIYLPRSLAEEDREVVVHDGPIVGGTETILVVEDDDDVRGTVVETLTDLGYRVLMARDAQSGLNVIESGIPIDVLFTDVVMPGPMKSTEMARRAKERLPNLVVLFTSGYTENSIVHGGKLDVGVELLSKPYSREALARRLRHLLANRAQITQASAGSSQAAPRQRPDGSRTSTSPRVLLVEDEALIRITTAEMLTDFGFDVAEAATATEALNLLQRNDIDVLVTDLGLPDLAGGELASRARGLKADLPIVFATGDSQPPKDFGDAILLGKPYDENDLRRAIESALSSRG